MRRLGILFLLLCVPPAAPRAADAPREIRRVLPGMVGRAGRLAQAVIAHAADWVKSHPGNVAHVNGFADPTGSKRANELLSDLRAQMVVDQLQTDGVDPKTHPATRPRLGAVRPDIAGEPPGGNQHQPAAEPVLQSLLTPSESRDGAAPGVRLPRFPRPAGTGGATTSSPAATRWC